MPLYEYECQSCHRRLEKIQKFSDPPLDVCPHCGGRLEKLISSPAFQFKGSGWYVTDYARKSDSPDKSEKAEKSDGSDKSDKPAKADPQKSAGDAASTGSDKAEKPASSKPASESGSNSKDSAKTTT